MDLTERFRAGHQEIQGETIAKFELFEQGWNPYSRYLDIDKIDLILRKKIETRTEYREIQVKYGKLFPCNIKWESELFHTTSWRFFKPNEFANFITNNRLFLIYVLSSDRGYQGDIFVFPISVFASLISQSIIVNTKNGEKRKMYISKANNGSERWFVRKNAITSNKIISEETCVDVTGYRRNFEIL